MEGKTLSILIVSFNSWHYLDGCIKTIIASNYPVLEIIVVDNASVDGSPEKLQAAYPNIRLVQNSENAGHVRAVNQGFDVATTDRVLLLDADTELDQDAIRAMSEFLDEHPEVCMVAPLTLDSDGKVEKTARNFPSVINGIFGRQSLLTKLFPNNPFSQRYLGRGDHDNSRPFQIEFISAACMMFRKNVLEIVGKWDEGFIGYWVDADWCKRIQKTGEVVYCVPEAVITHFEQNKAFRKKNPMRIIEFHKGAFRFYRLHYTLGIWDLRTLIAAIALATRAFFLLVINSLKRTSQCYSDPLSQNKKMRPQ
ncbi:MAG: glycosyltransferase family 2 protein [Promethearchaeota archaeon]|jgi:GT2 family glycosyltransferase